MKPDAIIFDMDGTLIDNNHYHFLAWQNFYSKYNRTLTLEEYALIINGRTTTDIFQNFFNREMTPEDITYYANRKNLLYRELYAPYIKPIAGLIPLLQQIQAAAIPMTVATSGTPTNVNFMFEHVPIQPFFIHVVDASEVIHGKPDPQIFLKAAQYANNADPKKCVAFEDSFAGIQAAKAAGMKVIAITTMQKREAIHNADMIIDDYTGVTLSAIENLLA